MYIKYIVVTMYIKYIVVTNFMLISAYKQKFDTSIVQYWNIHHLLYIWHIVILYHLTMIADQNLCS